jgi:arylsulfatase A-like enzyme
LLAAIAVGCAACGEARPRVRIVLVTLDTLRYDALAGRRDLPSQMPRTLARAAKGLSFERFHAASSSTQPSHASMFTGLDPWEHGVTRNGQVLADSQHTVAERLREHGFETHAVIGSFPVASRFGFAQGFDSYREDFTRDLFGASRWGGEVVRDGRFFSDAELVTEHAIASLDQARGDAQFFWFHYFDPHAPYGGSVGLELNKTHVIAQVQARPQRREAELRRLRELYDLDVAHLDGWLERLFARLDAEPGFETHVVVASDHGENLGEDGSIGHGDGLSEAEIRVPAFVLSPRAAPGVRDDVCGSVDVAATLLALAGVAAGDLDPRARDLTRPPPEPARLRAWGMRRTLAKKSSELRLDGRRHPLQPWLFYVAEPNGRIVRGDGRGVEPGGDGAGLAERFRELEARAGATLRSDPLDAESERALRELGYIQ